MSYSSFTAVHMYATDKHQRGECYRPPGYVNIIDLTLFLNPSQSMSPASGTGMSPSYPQSEPSPDYSMLIGSRAVQRPPSSSPPLTPNSHCVPTHIGK